MSLPTHALRKMLLLGCGIGLLAACTAAATDQSASATPEETPPTKTASALPTSEASATEAPSATPAPSATEMPTATATPLAPQTDPADAGVWQAALPMLYSRAAHAVVSTGDAIYAMAGTG